MEEPSFPLRARTCVASFHVSFHQTGRLASVPVGVQMAEITLDLRSVDREAAYRELAEHIDLVLAGVNDPIAEMATVSALVHHAFGNLWTGFYRVIEKGRLLRIGPYQGTLGCMEITFGRGVCGTAAAEGRIFVVEDVEQFPGHIACDSRSRSEIVVPVWDPHGELSAVFDVDSDRIGAFDQRDADGLERILARFASVSRR